MEERKAWLRDVLLSVGSGDVLMGSGWCSCEFQVGNEVVSMAAAGW